MRCHKNTQIIGQLNLFCGMCKRNSTEVTQQHAHLIQGFITGTIVLLMNIFHHIQALLMAAEPVTAFIIIGLHTISIDTADPGGTQGFNRRRRMIR